MGNTSNRSTVQFRIDQELKDQFEKVCSHLGLTSSSAFTLFAKTVVSQGKIPFSIELPRQFSENKYPFSDTNNLLTLNE